MKKKGQIAVELVFLSAIVVALITGFVSLAASLLQVSVRSQNKLQAFTIAEAGIEYYRWHLAHAPQDFMDGTSQPGPYVHDYYDKSGQKIGQFTLDVVPPPAGSSIVTITATGKVLADDTVTKIIRVKLGKSSFTNYAILVNGDLRFGTGTETFGPIFANGGIHFDGIAHNIVESAQQSYDDPDHGGHAEFGVHTHVDPIDPEPPAAVPSRPDVFMAGRAFPVPAVNFTQIIQDLATLKSQAQASGTYFASSSVFGYELDLATSGIYSMYKVTATTPPPNGCTNTSNEPGWAIWSVQSKSLISTGTIPNGGVIFAEDDLWVKGQINGERLTVAAGRFPDNPSTRANIIINSSTLYTNYDGTDSLGFIAQGDFNVGLFSEDILRIDGAIIAQNGRVGRHYYAPPNTQSHSQKCDNTVVRQKITFYGAIISGEQYGLGFNDSTGYQERDIIYDANLLTNQPPNFPTAGNGYTLISWEEVQ